MIFCARETRGLRRVGGSNQASLKKNHIEPGLIGQQPPDHPSRSPSPHPGRNQRSNLEGKS